AKCLVHVIALDRSAIAQIAGCEPGAPNASLPLPLRRGEAATAGVTLLAVVVPVAAANLAANFAARVVHRMDIAIGGVVFDDGHQCVEIPDRYVLPGGGEHVRACDGAHHRSAPRRTRLSSRRTVAQVRAEEHRDAASDVP